MRNCRPVFYLLALLVSFGAVTASAQEAEGPKALVMTAENLMAGDSRHRELAEAKGADANALLPGDIVRYRLLFTNITAVPVRNVEFKDPLPRGLQYLGGSATADRDDVVISYSIDGGDTYSSQPMIEEIVDGKRVFRAAPPQMYTHIRWTVQGWVQPEAQVTAEFRAQLPAAEMPEDPASRVRPGQ